MEPVVPGHPSLQPAPSGVTGTRGCPGTAAPGTIFPCWLKSPVSTQEQELGFSKPGITPVEGCAVPRARLAQEERLSCSSALHRCHPKATPVPVPIPGGCHSPRMGNTCLGCCPQARAKPTPGLRTELLLAKSGSRRVPWGGSSTMSPHWGPSAGAGLQLESPTEHEVPTPSWGVIALIRIVSLVQLRSSSRLESIGAAH